MVDLTGRRSRRRRLDAELVSAACDYAAHGWHVCQGAVPACDGSRSCSCDRIGCPNPGAHPLSPAWRLQATTDENEIRARWARMPDANIIVPTGRVFDVFDVPAAAGRSALDRLARHGGAFGAVAALGERRYLFFVTTRGAPDDEDEYWPSNLDCVPETVDDGQEIRWHCRNSYVLAPPSRLVDGTAVRWLVPPWRAPLPDSVVVLDVLADVCEPPGRAR